jgi:hypothetical protein
LRIVIKNLLSIKNYAWLNYENIDFKIVEWDFEKITNTYIVEEARDLVNERASYPDFSQYFCKQSDLNFWKENGTWQTPPIILDVVSLKGNKTKWSELKSPYQLVEGFSRFGYLHSTKMISELKKGIIADKHKIFLMSQR